MKLRELKPWTYISTKENKHILKFLWVDGMYARWHTWDGVVIMWHANQDVSEYWDVLDDNNIQWTKNN